jgi:hypothetical protein
LKKVLSILFVLIYLIPTVGIPINAHYCGGKLKSISILKFTSKCSCGKKPMKKNCCKNKTSILKIKNSHNFTKNINLNFLQPIKFIISQFTIQNTLFSEIIFEKNFLLDSPPPQKTGELYLLYNLLLI